MVEKEIMDQMQEEALERMRLLEIAPEDIEKFTMGEITKVIVEHESGRVMRATLTDEEKQMVQKISQSRDYVVFYLIQDEGRWPDGCTFSRYTLPVVTKYVNDYSYDKEDAIGRCHTLPAYVVNMEENDCSEYTEFRFLNVNGLLINVS